MEKLEKLITRVKNMMTYGLETESITQELLAMGWHRDLVYWAIKAAKFEITQEDSINA